MKKKLFKNNTTNLFIYLFLFIAATALPSFIRWAENQPYLDNILGKNTVFVSNSEPYKIDLNNLSDKTLYKVIKVTDGDTIKVLADGEELTLRLIGVDTPETVHPNKEVECFGKEASNFTKENLLNKNVYLMSDRTQDDVDKYGRALRYVVLEDGSLFNYELVNQGFAYEYTYRVPYEFQGLFKSAQNYAETNNLGLWGEQCQ